VSIVRSFELEDLPSLIDIVDRLPEYFTDDVPAKVREDLRAHQGRVIVDDGDLVGFSVVERRSAAAAEILWMAIAPVRRGRGAGTQLLAHIIDELRADDCTVVEVKTLDRSANYPPYEGTRAFWERRGFVQIDTIDPLPGWQPGNPCALYVAALHNTC
jgi:GNAT superfamily N-acetyltransferase